MNKEKEEKIVYTPGSLNTLNGFEKRFEKIEQRMDEHDNIISIHTKIMGLLQNSAYWDEKKCPQNCVFPDCPHKKQP